MLFQIPTTWSPQAIAASISAGIALFGFLAKGAHAAWNAFQHQRLQHRLGPDIYDTEAVYRAIRYYVEPHCTSVDPAQEAEPRSLIVAQEPVLSVLDRFLSDGAPARHMVVLADSGMGKTSLLLNYFARNQRRRKSKRHRIHLVHLGLKDADERIRLIPDPGKAVLFLDAFDEDTKAIASHRARISEILNLCSGFRRVLITSRTQFFPTDEEIPQKTGILKTGSRGMESGEYEFRKLYLAPFSDRMVKKYLRIRYPRNLRARRRAWNLVRKVPLLSIRPMLLTYIPDLVDARRSLTSKYDIYNELVEKWYIREAPWAEPQALDAFSAQLAVNLFVNRESRGSERIGAGELRPLAAKWGISLEDWQIRGRSLLNRDAEGNYKFAHRSIMEFLVSRVLVRQDHFRTNDMASADSEAYTVLSEHLRREMILSVDMRRAAYITDRLLGSDVLTDQINGFLHDAVEGGLVSAENLRVGLDWQRYFKFLEELKERARFLAGSISTNQADQIGVLSWVLAPPVYPEAEIHKRFHRTGTEEIVEITAFDSLHGITWRILAESSGENDVATGGGRSRHEVLTASGWQIPDWRQKLAALDQEEKVARLSDWQPVTTAILKKIAEAVPASDLVGHILRACRIAVPSARSYSLHCRTDEPQRVAGR